MVGVGDSFSKRRSCVDGAHPPHRTAEENFSSLTRVVEICPLTNDPLPLKTARAYVESAGVRMIGANRHASQATEYIKRGVGEGGGRMALKDGPDYGTSSEVGLSMVAETPEDTANRTARNSEGGTGSGSAALLSGSPTSNHSRVLGGQGQPDHAEVPSAECGPVNIPKKTKSTLDKSGGVWSWDAVKRIPSLSLSFYYI